MRLGCCLSLFCLLTPGFAGEGTAATFTHTYPVPHLATGWQNYLTVDNVGADRATFQVTWYNGAGVCVLEREVTLGGFESLRLDPAASADSAESGRITTDHAELQFRVAYIETTQQGTAEFALTEQTGSVLQFNFGVYPGDVVPLTWKGLALMNTGTATAAVRLYALDETGSVLAEAVRELAPNQRLRDIIENLFPGLTYSQVARVTAVADQPLAGINISGNAFRQLLFGAARQGGVAPVTQTGRPQSLPDFASLQLYDGDSPLNQAIAADAPVDPHSAALIAGMQNAGALVVQVGQYSAPVFFAEPDTPRVTVNLACGVPWELGVTAMDNVPMPAWAEAAEDVDGAANPPVACGEDADQDNHLVVLDPVNRCEYTFWQARRENGVWTASYGAAISMDSDGIFPNGMSSRGSGFSFLGGLIWPDELRTGRIQHALVFSYPFVSAGGPVAPATDSDGVSDAAFAIPEGARLQLDPDLDLAALDLTPYERTIARALQEYGMFLVDQGGASGIGLYAVDPVSAARNPYEGLWPNEDYVALPNIPLSAFRVLALGEQDASFRERLRLPDNACVTYR
ncbi:hypothetical protein APED_33675 [Acanthopleuribacter pedis]